MLFLQKFNSTLHINLKIVLFTHSDVNICYDDGIKKEEIV